MHFRPISFAALTAFLVLLNPQGTFAKPKFNLHQSVLAQATADEKAERSLNLCIEQLQTSQFQAAIGLCQQALEIYQELGDRQGEADSLNNLGVVYDSLGQYQQAIDYHEQSPSPLLKNSAIAQGKEFL